MDDREGEVRAFDESKAGVKGLVDAGVSKLPRIFIHDPTRNKNWNPPAHINKTQDSNNDSDLRIPLVDLEGPTSSMIVDQVRRACEEWGFFQVVNHGIPSELLREVIDGIRGFHEQELEVKRGYFSRDYTRKVLYHTNYDLYQAKAACWRDTLTLIMAPRPPQPHLLPHVCRDVMIRYTDEIMKLGVRIFELLSLALGLNPNRLEEMGCAEGVFAPCHYYPPCPEPELTMGLAPHADVSFITLLLQDQIGGLQVLYDGRWVNVEPIPGALVCNIGDLLKLLSNDKFVSAYHRVVNKTEGPRISVPYLFRSHLDPENSSRLYGPIKDLLSAENPPRYREITVKEILTQKYSTSNEPVNKLEKFKL